MERFLIKSDFWSGGRTSRPILREGTQVVDISSMLSKQDVFKDLTSEEIDQIADITQHEKYKPHETIFEDQHPGLDLYVVISGKVQVRIEAIIPHEYITLSVINPGEILGEFSMIDQEPRSASAVCAERTEMLVINGQKLHELFNNNNRIGYIVMKNIARIMCERIRRTNRLLLNSLCFKLR